LQRSSFRKPDRIIAAREIGFKTPRARQAAMPSHHAAMNSRRLMPAAKNEATDSKSSKRVLFKSEGRFRLGVSTIVECRLWVKNGPDALEMGCLFHPRKQTWLAELPGALIFINARQPYSGATTTIFWTCSHFGHSNVRKSEWAGPGSIRDSIIRP
jgi:hypothetical protein